MLYHFRNPVILLFVCSIIFLNGLTAQEMKTSWKNKIQKEIFIIQSQIKDSLDDYLFDTKKNNLSDSLRPAYGKFYENNGKGGHCPITIGLKTQISCSAVIMGDSIIEHIRGCWKPTNDDLKRTSFNIPIDYHDRYSEKSFKYIISEWFSQLKGREKYKFIYSGKVLIKLSQKGNTLNITSIFNLYQWVLKRKGGDFSKSDTDTFKFEEKNLPSIFKVADGRAKKKTKAVTSTKQKLTRIENQKLAINFFDIIDKLLLNKESSTYKNISKNFLSSLRDSLDKRFGLTGENNQYFRPNIKYLLNQFFNNYLSQPNVVLLNKEIPRCKQQTYDYQDGVKFDYFLKDGTKKVGNYKIVNYLRNLDEYNSLPSRIQRLFDYNKINAEELIQYNFHSLCAKQGEILYITIVSESSLNDLIYAMRIFDNHIMWFDIIEFFSRYATALIIQDNYTLANAWYNKAIRISRFDRKKQYAKTRKDIARRIMNIWNYRYTWVNYYLLIKDQVTKNFDVSFYCWGANNGSDFQEIITFQKVNDKPNFMAKIAMNQHWYNFDRYKDEITYASVDIVDFYLNIFNVNAAIKCLESKLRMEPDDYFGILIYLKHLFQDDNRWVDLKTRARNIPVIRKFLILNEPEIKDIPEFIHENFEKEYLNDKEKIELLKFFKSENYERLHLSYNIFHQAYIQILGSKTRPSTPQEDFILDKFFNERKK